MCMLPLEINTRNPNQELKFRLSRGEMENLFHWNLKVGFMFIVYFAFCAHSPGKNTENSSVKRCFFFCACVLCADCLELFYLYTYFYIGSFFADSYTCSINEMIKYFLFHVYLQHDDDDVGRLRTYIFLIFLLNKYS